MLQRGFSTCFSAAFISSFAEAGREAGLKPAGTLRGYALSPPAKAGGKKEPPEDGWEYAQGLYITHIPVVRVCNPLNGSGETPALLCSSPRFGGGVKMGSMSDGNKSSSFRWA